MRYLWHHIDIILESYRNEVPLHHFLKAFYKAHPKLGSRDRRALSDAIYAWFRCGKAFAKDSHSRDEQMLAALFLCDLRPKAFASMFPASWEPGWGQDLQSRLHLLAAAGYEVNLPGIFAYDFPVSEGISKSEWIDSLLMQPQLFLRIRKNHTKITQALANASIPARWLSDSCLALPNGTAVDQLLTPQDYVIQDASSQLTGSFFDAQPGDRWWDCCSGAGGKSLLLKDSEPGVRLLATDVRDRILHNLRQRFQLYGYPAPNTAVLDASDGSQVAHQLGNGRFDGIICDVPCTGSGTWARTPEGHYFFDPATLESYSTRGASILRNAVEYLKPEGRLVFITCSVFRIENEEVVTRVATEKGLTIRHMELINGISRQADCLFVAVLTRMS